MEQLNSTVFTSNISSPGPAPPLSWDCLVPAVMMSLCFLLGLPGNISVIILKPNWQHLSSLTQILMLNLAISDMLCLLTLPMWIYSFLCSWTFGLVACKLLKYLVYCCLSSSLLTVTVLSVQRYMQVVYLQRSLHQVGKKRLLVVLWLVAMILSIHTLVVQQPMTEQSKTLCQAEYSSLTQMVAVLLSESLVGFSLFSVLALAYICLHRKVNQAAFFNHPNTTRLVTSIIVTFFVLWMPQVIINVLGIVAIALNNKDLLKLCRYSWKIAGTLTFVNSCLNPLLYAFASRNICTVCQMNVHKYCC